MGNVLFHDQLQHTDSFSVTASHMLWQNLKKRDLRYRFKRNVRLGFCVVDFYCHELRLIVEVDDGGGSGEHFVHQEAMLLDRGYTIVRFTNVQVLEGREKVVDKIFFVCLHLSSVF